MKRWQIPQVLQNQAVSPISAASIYFKDILHLKTGKFFHFFPPFSSPLVSTVFPRPGKVNNYSQLQIQKQDQKGPSFIPQILDDQS